MTTATKLSPAEQLRQEAILLQQQAKKLDKAAAEAEREARQAKRKEEQRLELIAIHENKAKLGHELMAADTAGILNIEYTKNEQTGVKLPTIYFMIGNNRQDVDVDNSQSTLRYQLCGGYSDYNRRYYTRVSTVLTKIAEYIDDFDREVAAKNKAATKLEQGLILAKNQYPDAEIETVSRYTNFHREYKVIIVTGTNGIVEFTVVGDDSVELSVLSFKPNNDHKIGIADFILK